MSSLEADFRLPPQIRPSFYHLHLIIHSKRLIYGVSGTITFNVDLSLEDPTSRLYLHALDLDLSLDSFLLDGTMRPIAVSVHPAAQVIELEFPSGGLSSGQHSLTFQMEKHFADQRRGFFVTHHKGRPIFATMLEPTYARAVFPCFDEPAMKASFAIAVDVDDPRLVILSNAPANLTEQDEQQNRNRVVFAPTPPMSTYLLSLLIGELHYIEATTSKSGIAVRVYAPADEVSRGQLALQTAIHGLDFYEEFFGVPYLYRRYNMVAVPDVPCISCADELWGTPIFFFRCILVRRQSNSTLAADVPLDIIDTVLHEMSHQWFGDLVTPAWWNDLWLKEGVAQYVTWLALRKVLPKLASTGQVHLNEAAVRRSIVLSYVDDRMRRAWDLSLVPESRPIALSVSAVRTPADIEQLYDSITYDKTSTVLRMLHKVVGGRAFRGILHQCLVRFQFASIVTKDFLDIVVAQSNETAAEMMATWLFNSQIPVVEIDSASVAATATTSKSQSVWKQYIPFHLSRPQPPFVIPLEIWRFPANPSQQPVKEIHWLRGSSGVLDMEDANQIVLFNANWVAPLLLIVRSDGRELVEQQVRSQIDQAAFVLSRYYLGLLGLSTTLVNFLQMLVELRPTFQQSSSALWSIVLDRLETVIRLAANVDDDVLEMWLTRFVAMYFNQARRSEIDSRHVKDKTWVRLRPQIQMLFDQLSPECRLGSNVIRRLINSLATPRNLDSLEAVLGSLPEMSGYSPTIQSTTDRKRIQFEAIASQSDILLVWLIKNVLLQPFSYD